METFYSRAVRIIITDQVLLQKYLLTLEFQGSIVETRINQTQYARAQHVVYRVQNCQIGFISSSMSSVRCDRYDNFTVIPSERLLVWAIVAFASLFVLLDFISLHEFVETFCFAIWSSKKKPKSSASLICYLWALEFILKGNFISQTHSHK